MKPFLSPALWLSICFALVLSLQNCKKPTPDPIKPGGTTNPGSTTTTPGSSTTGTVSTAPTVSTATVPTTSGITATSANVSAVLNANGGAAITQHGFVYSKTAQTPTLSDSKTELGATSGPFPLTITSKLTNLEANTTYYVRAYATNEKGTGYGVVVQVKTTEPAATGLTFHPTSTSTEISPNSMKVQSSITALGGGVITQYGHCWSKTNQLPTTADTKTQLGAPSTATLPILINSSLTGLDGGTTYYIRPYATVGTNTTYGAVIQVKTIATSAAFSINSVESIVSGLKGDTDGALAQASFSFSGGITVAANGAIYVSNISGNNHKIRMILNGQVTTIAGSTAGNKDGIGTSAQFNEPTNLAIIPSTKNELSFRVVDSRNNRVRYVTGTGATNRMVGTLDVGNLTALYDVAINTTGTIVADKNRVFRSTANTGEAVTLFTAPPSSNVFSLATTTNDDVFALYGQSADAKLVRIAKDGTPKAFSKAHFGLDTYTNRIYDFAITPDGKIGYFSLYDAANSKAYLGVIDMDTETVGTLLLPAGIREIAVDQINPKVVYALGYNNSAWQPFLYKITLK